jgi:pyruvyltransferase
VTAHSGPINAFWCRIPSRANFGDALTPWLIQRIAGVYPRFVRPDDPRPKHFVTGSIIAYAGPATTVWGAGIMTAHDAVSAEARLLAVRGPLTRARALACGADCPTVYGDPALLLPDLYQPSTRTGRIGGLLAHFSDRPRLEEAWTEVDGLRLIDIQNPVESVIDEIVSSAFVASSSLHGLIVAHAYGVPAVWVRFRDLPAGDDSKFHDYYLSLGQTPPEPLRLPYGPLDPVQLVSRARCAPAMPDLDRLRAACPFGTLS